MYYASLARQPRNVDFVPATFEESKLRSASTFRVQRRGGRCWFHSRGR